MTNISLIEPREQTQRIIALAIEAQSGAEDVKKRVKLCIDAVRRCGKLLEEEKQFVTREMGRGKWIDYFEANFSKVLPLRTAQDWMKKYGESAIAYSKTHTLEDTSAPENPEFGMDSNTMRNGMLALGLFPKKVMMVSEGKIAAPRLDASHLAHISWLEDWIDELRENTITPERVAQLRGDFRKIAAFCRDIEEGRP